MEKSFVTLIQNLCNVCGKVFDTGDLALDKRGRAKFDMHTVMGWGLCPEHEAKYKEGYIALVAVDENKSDKLPNGQITPQGAYRMGPVAHVRASVWPQIFNTPLPVGKSGLMLPVVFCDQEVLDKLAQIPGAETVAPKFEASDGG